MEEMELMLVERCWYGVTRTGARNYCQGIGPSKYVIVLVPLLYLHELKERHN